jgi:hypothetical protein
LNRLTVAVGRAFRQDSGTLGAAAEKRSFDRRTQKRFSEAAFQRPQNAECNVARPETSKKFCAIIRAGRFRFPSRLRVCRPF